MGGDVKGVEWQIGSGDKGEPPFICWGRARGVRGRWRRGVTSASVLHTDVASPATMLLATRAGGDPEQGHVNNARE